MIKINDYRIRKDTRNFIIDRLAITKDGQEVWRPDAYYGKLEDLAKGLLRLMVQVQESEDLLVQVRLLIDSINQVERSISEQLKVAQFAINDQSGQSVEDVE